MGPINQEEVAEPLFVVVVLYGTILRKRYDGGSGGNTCGDVW